MTCNNNSINDTNKLNVLIIRSHQQHIDHMVFLRTNEKKKNEKKFNKIDGEKKLKVLATQAA